jgi:DNA (cytosine-5)-methyltransferase 1
MQALMSFSVNRVVIHNIGLTCEKINYRLGGVGKAKAFMLKGQLKAKKTVYNSIELFAGIGGIRLGFQQAFGERIKFLWANDFNSACCKTYENNFGKGSIVCGDISEIIKDLTTIPEHDILVAGFPCQPFSMAGEKKGFADETRGTLFYSLAKVIEAKKPTAFLLENVSHFEHHDKGNTWKTVKTVLEKDLGYKVFAQRLNAKYFGVPQNRPRFFMVGFRDCSAPFSFPEEKGVPPPLKSILEHDVADHYYLSQKYLNGLKKHRQRHEAKGHGFGYKVLDIDEVAQALVVGGMGRERNLIKNTPVADHWKPGDDLMKRNEEGIRKVTPLECARLQGYPPSYKLPEARSQAYRQFANSVAVPVIKAIAVNVLMALDSKP